MSRLRIFLEATEQIDKLYREEAEFVFNKIVKFLNIFNDDENGLLDYLAKNTQYRGYTLNLGFINPKYRDLFVLFGISPNHG